MRTAKRPTGEEIGSERRSEGLFSFLKLKRCACSHNITLYLPPLIAHFERSTERRDNEKIHEAERIRRVIEEGRYAAFGHCRFRPKCDLCTKINSRNFENEDERRLHTAVEHYETFNGVKYEKEMLAVANRLLLEKYDPRNLEELEKIKTSFKDKLDRVPTSNGGDCNHCRGCFNECAENFPRFEEMFDIIGTRRPLIFDPMPFFILRSKHLLADYLRGRDQDQADFDDWVKKMQYCLEEICGE